MAAMLQNPPATSPEPGLLDPLAFRMCIIEYADFAEVPEEPIGPLNAKLLSFICCLWVSKWRFSWVIPPVVSPDLAVQNLEDPFSGFSWQISPLPE